VYSLLSSAVLAADLVRHAHGSLVADTLDRVLALTPAEVAALGPPAPEPVRRRVLSACGTAHVGAALDDVRLSVEADAPQSEPALAGLATRLEESLLGSLEDLHAMVVREDPVAALPSYAKQVVCDALTAAWAGAEAALPDVRLLAAPWEEALDPVPPALPRREWTPALRQVLDDVPRRTPEQWQDCVSRRRRSPRMGWSEAMHAACDAALQAGRVGDIARAQLAAARALSLTHTPVSRGAAALVLTGAVQAVCTRDLVAPEVSGPLLATWEGPAGPR
jgi:hypothetical protein